jgi:hypothetical protein
MRRKIMWRDDADDEEAGVLARMDRRIRLVPELGT